MPHFHSMDVKHVYFSYTVNVFVRSFLHSQLFFFFFFWCADFVYACLPFVFSLRYISSAPHIQQRKICEFIVHVAMAKTKRTFILFICSLCERYLHRFRYDARQGGAKRKYENMTLPKRAFRVFALSCEFSENAFYRFSHSCVLPFSGVCARVCVCFSFQD